MAISVDVIGDQELAESERIAPDLYPINKRIFDLLEQIREELKSLDERVAALEP